ncbi:MAG: biopolymer transporter ExbD [Rikenellaceae bacterium]
MKKKGDKGTPGINTSSLPDIIFMLLFFFMTTTVMREVELKVEVKLPGATEIQKLEKKSLVSYIYVGPPTAIEAKKWGTAPRLQLNDSFRTKEEILDFIAAEREKISEADRPFMTVNIKGHKDTKMGIITDVKQELRKADALKISYAAQKVLEVQ